MNIPSGGSIVKPLMKGGTIGGRRVGIGRSARNISAWGEKRRPNSGGISPTPGTNPLGSAPGLIGGSFPKVMGGCANRLRLSPTVSPKGAGGKIGCACTGPAGSAGTGIFRSSMFSLRSSLTTCKALPHALTPAVTAGNNSSPAFSSSRFHSFFMSATLSSRVFLMISRALLVAPAEFLISPKNLEAVSAWFPVKARAAFKPSIRPNNMPIASTLRPVVFFRSDKNPTSPLVRRAAESN